MGCAEALYCALPFLRGLFADDVLNAIKLHVDAKRFLCAMLLRQFSLNNWAPNVRFNCACGMTLRRLKI